MTKLKQLSLEQGLKYPWGEAKRQWNILWILIPIVGFLAIVGYVKKILLSVYKGHVKELPEWGNFWENLKQGTFLFVKMIPLIVLTLILNFIPGIGRILGFLMGLFVIPFMLMHLIVTDKFSSTFDFKKWWKVVAGNFSEYLVTVVYGFVSNLVYMFLSFVLIGIPGAVFGGNIFYADFYRRFVK
jgi:hypothetical protein